MAILPALVGVLLVVAVVLGALLLKQALFRAVVLIARGTASRSDASDRHGRNS